MIAFLNHWQNLGRMIRTTLLIMAIAIGGLHAATGNSFEAIPLKAVSARHAFRMRRC